mmetsp:Transcript_3895/g.9937  ORF Transcript_3895/g.9937 Transcript_3895/m.9937 type:complete len:274 (+) Transcript_3895:304-1125(+)
MRFRHVFTTWAPCQGSGATYCQASCCGWRQAQAWQSKQGDRHGQASREQCEGSVGKSRRARLPVEEYCGAPRHRPLRWGCARWSGAATDLQQVPGAARCSRSVGIGCVVRDRPRLHRGGGPRRNSLRARPRDPRVRRIAHLGARPLAGGARTGAYLLAASGGAAARPDSRFLHASRRRGFAGCARRAEVEPFARAVVARGGCRCRHGPLETELRDVGRCLAHNRGRWDRSASRVARRRAPCRANVAASARGRLGAGRVPAEWRSPIVHGARRA